MKSRQRSCEVAEGWKGSGRKNRARGIGQGQGGREGGRERRSGGERRKNGRGKGRALKIIVDSRTTPHTRPHMHTRARMHHECSCACAPSPSLPPLAPVCPPPPPPVVSPTPQSLLSCLLSPVPCPVPRRPTSHRPTVLDRCNLSSALLSLSRLRIVPFQFWTSDIARHARPSHSMISSSASSSLFKPAMLDRLHALRARRTEKNVDMKKQQHG